MLLSLIAPSALAAPGDLAVRIWGSDEGLPQHSVTSIVQGPDGYLWLGTSAGLVRFDGVTFRVHVRREHPGLPSDRIEQIVLDGRRLWLTTARGAAWFEDGRLSRVDGVARARGMARAPGGGVWITQDGAPTWTGGTAHPGALALDAAASGDLVFPFFTPDGSAWAGDTASPRLLRWDPRTEGVTATLLAGDAAQVLAQLSDGSLLVRAGRGAFRVTSDGAEPLAAEIGIPRAALVREDGTVLVGTQEGGLLVLGSDLTPLRRIDALPATISSLARDREGHVWVGTDERGLARLAESDAETLQLPAPLAGRSVSFVAEDSAGGVWVSVPCDGVVRLVHGVVQRWLRDELLNPCVWAFAEQPTGVIWLGTWGGGLARVDLSTEEVRTVVGPEDGFDVGVKALLPEVDGSLHIGTTDGLYRLVDGDLVRGSDVGDVQSLRRGPDGALWIATEQGVFRLDGGVLMQSSDVGARDVAFHGDSVLMTTYGRGLVISDGEGTQELGAELGFEDDYLGRFFEDPTGMIWISGNSGLVRLDPEQLKRTLAGGAEVAGLLRLTSDHGLPSTECNGGNGSAGFVAADGRLYVPTIRGVGVVDTLTIARRRRSVPVPRIEHVQTKRTLWDPPPRLVVLEPDERRVEVAFTGLLLNAPGQIRFRYRLDGDSWKSMGAQRSVLVSHLGVGRHTFEVQARLAGAEWSSAARVDLHARARLHETRAFMAGTYVAALLMFLMLVRFYRRREATVQALVDERTQELAALNGTLAKRANEDPLTGVASRRLLEDRLSLYWGVARRDDKPISLLMVDVDRFKELNDRYGHPAGDRCLAELGKRLSARARRAVDVVARYGGDEFALLLPDTDEAGAARLAELLWGAVRQDLFEVEPGVPVPVTVSVGAASRRPRQGSSPEELIAAADRALYGAKRGGRDRVESEGDGEG